MSVIQFPHQDSLERLLWSFETDLKAIARLPEESFSGLDHREIEKLGVNLIGIATRLKGFHRANS